MFKLIFCISLSVVTGLVIGLGYGAIGTDNSLFDAEHHLNYADKSYIDSEAAFYRRNEIRDNAIKIKGIRKNAGPYHHIVLYTSKKYKVDPSLVSALIEVESNWNSKAVSHRGAVGLMQLMPATAKEMKVKNLFDPRENIEGGTRYLRYLLDKFKGDITLAVAAYNAGPTKVAKLKRVPRIRETKRYVRKVLSIYGEEKPLQM